MLANKCRNLGHKIEFCVKLCVKFLFIILKSPKNSARKAFKCLYDAFFADVIFDDSFA